MIYYGSLCSYRVVMYKDQGYLSCFCYVVLISCTCSRIYEIIYIGTVAPPY